MKKTILLIFCLFLLLAFISVNINAQGLDTGGEPDEVQEDDDIAEECREWCCLIYQTCVQIDPPSMGTADIVCVNECDIKDDGYCGYYSCKDLKYAIDPNNEEGIQYHDPLICYPESNVKCWLYDAEDVMCIDEDDCKCVEDTFCDGKNLMYRGEDCKITLIEDCSEFVDFDMPHCEESFDADGKRIKFGAQCKCIPGTYIIDFIPAKYSYSPFYNKDIFIIGRVSEACTVYRTWVLDVHGNVLGDELWNKPWKAVCNDNNMCVDEETDIYGPDECKSSNDCLNPPPYEVRVCEKFYGLCATLLYDKYFPDQCETNADCAFVSSPTPSGGAMGTGIQQISIILVASLAIVVLYTFTSSKFLRGTKTKRRRRR